MRHLLGGLFECEICKRRFVDEAKALQCEAVGVIKDPEPGLMFGFHDAANNNHFYTYCTTTIFPGDVRNNPHYPVPLRVWCTRDNHLGDSIGTQRTAFDYNLLFTPNFGRLDPMKPSFERMVQFLRELKIEPRVWNGVQIVPLAEYEHSWMHARACV